MADGHLNVCKSCVKQRVRKRYVDNINSMREKDRQRNKIRQSNPIYKNTQRKATLKYRQKTKGIYWSKIYKNRPSNCSICGILTDKLHAHHPSYSQPMQVVWVCVPCHSSIHKGVNKLNE